MSNTNGKESTRIRRTIEEVKQMEEKYQSSLTFETIPEKTKELIERLKNRATVDQLLF